MSEGAVASRRRMKQVGALALAAAAALGPAAAGAQEPQELLGADATVLQREPQVRPADLGSDPLDKLRYPDATEGLDLIEAPTPDNQGNAALDLRLSIPRGRAGVQPELAIAYDSGGDAGWLGTGWDLGVGEITIDTRWGVPRYSGSHETETYMLDGDVLGPTAVRADGDLDERVGGRVEFTRRVDNEFERIVRHGTHPSNYWWEVHDKNGGVRWYGGTPDQGGVLGHRDPGTGLDEKAVLRTRSGGPIYRWALSAQRDSYANLIRYEYEQETGERVGRDEDERGTQLYLKRILYTAALPVSGHPEDPAYEIRFLRDDDVEGERARKDVTIDATGGLLEVTSDLLRRIEVWTGRANEDESTRTFDMLVKAWNLEYEEGAFGKSLLKAVEQRDRDDEPVGKHDFEYYDEVRDENGDYEGFTDTNGLDTKDDNLDAKVLNPFGVSALGSSNAFSADARVYLGFSPLGPTKSTSAGVGLAINGGYTETLLELIDLNGDQLPDKVFRDAPGNIKFRLNQARPRGGSREFDGGGDVEGIGKLSDEFSIGFGVGVEGYIASASLSFNVGANVTVGESYFEDVNSDGLPDFVQAGRVRFNHLDGNGVPRFSSSSAPTKVPIGTSNLDPSELADLKDLEDLEEQQDENSPPLDTVRRWVAPYPGTVAVAGTVTLDPPPDTRVPRPPTYDGDGVRVAIQRGSDEELWVARLEQPGDSATPTGVSAVTVSAGQAIYFRTQTVDHGALDQVRWNPLIQYTSIDGAPDAPPTDVNGRSQTVFSAAQDFNLAGRPAPQLFMPLKGTVHLEGVLTKLRPTSDDIRVLVRRNGVPVIDYVVDDQQVYPDGLDLSTDFDVAAPTDDGVDVVTVEVLIDSAVDVSALRWAPRLYYVDAEDAEGKPVETTDPDTGEPSLEIETPPAIDVYPARGQFRPVEPWKSPTDSDLDFRVDFLHDDEMKPGRVVVAVKQRNRLVKKTTGTIRTDDGFPTSSTVTLQDVPLEEDEEYWIEVAVKDSETIKAIQATTVLLGGAVQVPHQRYGQPQDIFPPGYRNWAYAGYNGAGERATQRIDEDAFKFDEDDYSDRNPADFEDDGFNNQKRKGDPFVPIILDLLDEDRKVVGTAPVWRGAKDNIVGGASFARTSRKGVDDPQAIPQPSELPSGGGEGVRAVRKVGVTGPTFSFAAGFLIANASFTGGPSFGLMDYTDMNGDGFPDIVAPGYIKYTGPRGDYMDSGGGIETVSQDVTFGVGGGFAGTTGSIKANAEGDVATSQDVASTSGSEGTSGVDGSGAGGGGDDKELWGFSIGGSFGVQAQYTNPGMPTDSLSEGISELTGDVGLPLENEIADVNGDGLPDQVLVDLTDIRVRLNTGYGFSDPIPWSLGGFESQESYSGTFGANLGFQFNKKEFSGGLSYTEDVAFPRYTWVDVDGDGVLDRLRKDGTQIKVAFGTGAGVMDEVDYGDFTEGSIDLAGNIFSGAGIPTGEQVSQSRGRNLSAGADFTFGIGPLCVPTPLCYIIVNPGVHLDYGVSNSVVGLTDVNGDGYPDSVRSNGDEGIEVRRNTRGRTNLLRSVTNPLGGKIRLGYDRYGNTTEQPYSQWALTSVEDDDGRPGDGPDVLLRTYEYRDGAYDRLEREMLGYGTVIERQREFEDDGDVYDDELLRSVERTYLNDTVFDSGLQTSEKLLSPGAGTPVRETRSEWEIVDLATGDPMTVTDPVARLSRAGAPLRKELEQTWYDGDGGVGQRTRNTFEYNRVGDIVRQVDHGELETTADDLTAVTTYSNCELSASEDLKQTFPCGPGAGPPTDPDAPPLPARRTPLDDQRGCGTWLSVPVRFVVRDADGKVLRERDGAPLACDNAGVSILEERLGDGEVAVTELGYDDFGSYDSITYPENADGERLSVVYEFDGHSHANIARTTEVRGELNEDGEAEICEDQPALCSTAEAKYDERTGLISERTDPNDQKTSYTYDPVGRIQSIRGPYEQDNDEDDPSISFEYHPTAPDYAWAIARHHDDERPDDPIETVSFVDGRGRETETKQDATVHRGVEPDAEDVMVVSGAVEFDALGRPVKEWFPTEEPLGTAGVYKYSTSPVNPTETSYSLSDRVTEVVHPNGAKTQTSYGYGAAQAGGPTVFETTVTDREGKQQRAYTDVRQHVLAAHDGTPPLRTRYRYDAIGQLVEVVEPGGARTEHTYDLAGRRTSTRTPDAGLNTHEFDAAGNLVAKVTPVLRAAGQQVTYEYDFDRLVRTNYQDDTPDVSYEWGDGEAGDNAVGRVTRVVDGARDQRLTYDRLGEVERETTQMLVHNLNDEVGERVTYETSFTYDTFGRLQELTYPDGEVLRHHYDSGGLLRGMDGEKGDDDYRYLDRLEYDEFLDRRLQLAGNGVLTVYNYDPRTRHMVRQVTNTPAREVQDLNYDYDLEGNVERLDNTLPAPVPELFGGPGWQDYDYDQYYRLTTASGSYSFAPKKTRTYSLSTSYDAHGNTATKVQTDRVQGREQKPTSYDLGTLRYDPQAVHQVRSIGSRSYTHDADGNQTGWTDARTGQNRTQSWDSAGDMRSVADNGSTTRYTYDGDGNLALERGPSGETAFVNPWWTVRNATQRTKHFWAGGDRLAHQQVMEDEREHKRYFLHKDLQGSTNVVTADDALVYQHLEHFPGGETWVREQSDEHRTPYQHAGGYFDEVRGLTRHGARWYDPREQLFQSADPLLSQDPEEVVGDPALLPAYAYAESNPLRLSDAGGRAPNSVRASFTSALGDLVKLRRRGQPHGLFAVEVANRAVNVVSSVLAARAQGGDADARAAADRARDRQPAPADTGGASVQSQAAALAGEQDDQRSSRLWGTKAEAEAAEKRIKTFTDFLEVKPLIEIQLVKGKDGYRLKDVKLSPGVFFQKSLMPKAKTESVAKKPEAEVDPAAPASQADPEPDVGAS